VGSPLGKNGILDFCGGTVGLEVGVSVGVKMGSS
jgi:hypothetical protein